MEKILLFSTDKRIIENTKKISEGKYELIYDSYKLLDEREFQYIDAVIIQVDYDLMKRDLFEFIIKAKVKLGTSTPILAIIENGTPQDIFSILQLGVFDYVESIDDLLEYEKKINNLILWSWYLKKYGDETKRQ